MSEKLNKEEAQKIAEKNAKKREFLLNKNVNADSVQPIVEGINEINSYDDEQQEKDPSYVRKPIKLIVDSYGGNIYCGMLLVNTVDSSETPIHTYCLSKAMSMGFTIFTVGHKRFASPSATLMYHDGGTTIGDTLEGIQQSIDQTKRVVKRMDGMITAYTKIPQTKLDKVKSMKQNWYIFGDDAVELGIVDELIYSTKTNYTADKSKK